MATGTLEKCALHGLIPVSTVPDRRQTVWRDVGERFADVNVVNRMPHGGGGGYGMSRHKLRTTNTIAFYQWQFECTEIS